MTHDRDAPLKIFAWQCCVATDCLVAEASWSLWQNEQFFAAALAVAAAAAELVRALASRAA